MMIRPATASDIEKIAECYVKNHVETYTGLLSDAYFASLTVEYAKEKWSVFLAGADKQLLTAYDGEAFLGFAAGMPDESLQDTWYIATLQIAENARGKGIGTAFIKVMRKYALAHEYSRMSVCIVKGNDKAGKLYQKLGAAHFMDFEDDFCGTVSHSEKLVWKDLTMVRKLYPYGKKKAFNVTYDDGVLQDVPFVDLMNRYGLKGTFNLNFALMENEFEWVHEKGCVVKRLSTDAVKNLYAGHEVASHTLNHPYMHDLSREGVMWELSQDKRKLEVLFGKEVKGFAVPFDYYSDLIEECVKECGFTYGRISEMSYSFRPQTDYSRWKATVFHCEACLEELTQKFLETEEELALFQIVGHSYDLDTEHMWDRMENIFQTISKQEDILPMTTIEIIEYLKAMEKAEITEEYIRNHSDRSLWFAMNGVVCEVKPNEKVMRE